MHNFYPKQYYFINKFDKEIIGKQSKKTALVFRNYTKKVNVEEIIKIRNYCKKLQLKFLISNNFKLACMLKLDGAYIPSFNKSFNHLGYNIRKKFIILGSAHNLKEIRLKEMQKVQLLVISSVFKKKNYLGINKFRNISKLTSKKIIALGGVSKKNKSLLKNTNCFGFAGISFFE